MGEDTAAFPLSYHKAQARPPRREGQALRTNAVSARPPRANMRPRRENGAGQCRDAGDQGQAVLTRPGLRGAAGRHSPPSGSDPPGEQEHTKAKRRRGRSDARADRGREASVWRRQRHAKDKQRTDRLPSDRRARASAAPRLGLLGLPSGRSARSRTPEIHLLTQLPVLDHRSVHRRPPGGVTETAKLRRGNL
jgi:hypothetical protein